MKLRSLLVAASMIACAFARSQTSWAQPREGAMTAIARSHLENGARYYSIGRYAEAAREFRAAYDLSHRAEVLFNLARARRRRPGR